MPDGDFTPTTARNDHIVAAADPAGMVEIPAPGILLK